MMALFLLLACAGRADADGAPPGIDDATPPPAEGLGTLGDGSTVAEEVPARVIEGIDTPPAAELLTLTSPPEIQDVGEGEVEAGGATESGGVVIDPALIDLSDLTPAELALAEMVAEKTAAEITRRGPLGGGTLGLSQAQWFDHLKVFVGLIISVLGGVLANAIRRLYRSMDAQTAAPAVPAPAPAPDEVQRVLAGQLADARQEVEALQRERALLLERERRAAQAEKDADQAKRAMERTPDMELLEALDAVGRAAEARDRALPPAV